MKTIKQTYKINAPLDEVWRAFVDPKIIKQWTGSKAKMDDKVGTKFDLWNHEIYGTNTKVIKNKLLEQDWYSRPDWTEPTKVKFTFSNDGDVTTVDLLHTDVPDDAVKDIDDGWKVYYLVPIKELLEQ